MHKLLSRHGADIVNHYNYGDRLVSRTAVDPTGSYAITSKIIYDTDGESIGFCVDTNINPADCPEEKIGVPLGVYLYEKNLQGDVVKVIHGATGTVLANFSYDAYGNLEVHADDIGEVIGAILVLAITPQLYRGYIYVPLGDNLCYYLGSRFYNPQLGRFLNADRYCDTEVGMCGTNMFAYCTNNPIVYFDPTGEYNRLNAVAYAKKWTLGLNLPFLIIFNIKYHYYKSGDCANFVSQCLYAGGIGMTSSWYSYGLLGKNGISPAWSQISYQRPYFNQYRYRRKIGFYSFWTRDRFGIYKLCSENDIDTRIKELAREVKIGDIMYLDTHTEDGITEYNHAVIITKVDKNDIYYSAHTANRYNQSLKKMIKNGGVEHCLII